MAGDPCTNSWYGVTCADDHANYYDAVDSVVTRLMLEDNSLHGTLPSELGWLTAMTSHLVLADNLLSGTLPSQLGNLGESAPSTFQNVFWVNSNQLTGPVPTQLGRFTAMTRQLYLFENDFAGALPSEIGRLTALTGQLKLQSNAFTGVIPTQRSPESRGSWRSIRRGVAALGAKASKSNSPSSPARCDRPFAIN